MKKLLSILLILIAFNSTHAQQKIKIDPMQLMQLQIAINPSDTIWRNFKIPDSQFRGLPVFIPVTGSKFYSKEEITQIATGLDKLLNPDKFFTTQQEYSVFYREFINKWNRVKVEKEK